MTGGNIQQSHSRSPSTSDSKSFPSRASGNDVVLPHRTHYPQGSIMSSRGDTIKILYGESKISVTLLLVKSLMISIHLRLSSGKNYFGIYVGQSSWRACETRLGMKWKVRGCRENGDRHVVNILCPGKGSCTDRGHSSHRWDQDNAFEKQDRADRHRKSLLWEWVCFQRPHLSRLL